MQETKQVVLTDASRLVIESMARAGVDAFIGYPITPANLLYLYGSRRMPLMLPAPDEITTLQWMSGLSAAGKIPVTATSFPGYALMVESINMAYMMELPMVIILVQRLGPATGTATCGAQGDLMLLHGTLSGGHPLPVLATSDFNDSWSLAAEAVNMAVTIRSPVVLLTSKEEIMTSKSFDLTLLNSVTPVERPRYSGTETYKPYHADATLVPPFLPLGNPEHQVRFNASTHDTFGILQHSTDEALGNTARLERKIGANLDRFTRYEYDCEEGADTLIVSFGITAAAAKDAVAELRRNGIKVSCLIPKTLLPVPGIYRDIIDTYPRVIVAEENINRQFVRILYGTRVPDTIRSIGSIGRMITPASILKERDLS
jgi:2-oxoglutarate/2-oxoacid ferredoxin oxidoreductase subunit alpha